jgi:4-hydroxy-4-methyl-2-oxoglutarate aldolase
MDAESRARDQLARLRRLDCCALSDAMDRLGLQGIASGIPHRSGTHRIAGRAITVKLGVGLPPPGAPRHLGTTAVELAGPDHVIVIEQRSGVEAGSWGGLLTLGAKLRGVAGVIADGPVRDIDEAIAHDFAIFSTALTALTARGRIVELGTNVSIAIGSVSVQPGDYVLADRSGIAFIKPGEMEKVLAAAETIAAREAAMANALLQRKPIGAVMGADYEHLLRATQ